MRITVRMEGVEDLLEALDAKTHQRVVIATVNQVARDTRQYILDSIIQKYNLQKRLVAARIKVRSADRRKAYSSIFIRSKKFNVAEFGGARQTGSGVEFQALKGQRETFKGAFLKQPKGKEYAKRGQINPVTGTRPLALSQGLRRPGYAYKVFGIYPSKSGGGTIIPSQGLSTAEMFDHSGVQNFIRERFLPTLNRKVIEILTKPKRKKKK